mmetsp:Transcript_20243/g.43666  ORF Transcript_20243/g.43666 Transcript_20243/m.43666 type:complete len:1095 (-) Transcript_20243:396-3680(-)
MSSGTSKLKRSRPSSSGGPKTHLQSDFAKRPRAKVGKRATKLANVTDTKFRAASVQVRSQDGVHRASGDAAGAGAGASQSRSSLELMSSRGKALSLLVSTLSHHSHTVRLSSLSGIRDAISSAMASAAAVRANLNSIVPALGRCFVDDDHDVRAGGMDVLREVASRVGEEDDDDDEDNTGSRSNACIAGVSSNAEVAARHLSPYLPLLVAYVTSALNSLDVSIRLDGARGVETIVQVLGTDRVGEHATKLLPGFVRVMVDAKAKGAGAACASAFNVTGGDTGGKSKKSKSNQSKKNVPQNAKSAAVLRSLVLLLKAAAEAASCSSDDEYDRGITIPEGECNASSPFDLAPSLSQPDLVFVKGGSASNVVLAYRGSNTAHLNDSLLSLGALAYADGSSVTNTNTDPSTGLAVPTQVELYNRLRDRLVELEQTGHISGGGRRGSGGGGLCLQPSFVEEMNAIVSAVRLLWTLYSRSVIVATAAAPSGDVRKDKDSIESKLRAITAAIQSQLIAILPITLIGVQNDTDGGCNATNAILCSAVGELGCVLDPFEGRKGGDDDSAQTSSAWTQAVFSYVLPRLERKSGDDIDVTILKVVGNLLLGPYLDAEKTRRMELLTKFGSAFFSSSTDISVGTSLCVSSSGRLAAMLLVALLLRHMPIDVINIDPVGGRERALVGSMAQALPLYLVQWEGRFPLESEMVLAALVGVVRLYRTGTPMTVDGVVLEVFDEIGGASDDAPCNSSSDADPLVLLVRSLRVSMVELYEVPKKSKTDKQVASRQQSIFEIMPEPTQRLVLGLFGLLQYPKEAAVLSIAKICSRSSLNHEMKDYVMEVMHDIRRSLPMQLYLTFLVNGSGITKAFKDGKKKKKRQNDQEENDVESIRDQVFALDIAIERLCRALVLCGGNKVLPMLVPLLLSWLGDVTTPADVNAMVQRRAVFAILVCISVDDSADDGICLEDLDPKINDAVAVTAVDLLCQNGDAQDDKHIRFLSPVLALLMKGSELFETVMDKLLQRVLARDGVGMDEKTFKGVIRSLMLTLKHTGLAVVIKNSRSASVLLEKLAVAIENKVANGPLDRIGGVLRTEVQLHLGRQIATTQ